MKQLILCSVVTVKCLPPTLDFFLIAPEVPSKWKKQTVVFVAKKNGNSSKINTYKKMVVASNVCTFKVV